MLMLDNALWDGIKLAAKAIYKDLDPEFVQQKEEGEQAGKRLFFELIFGDELEPIRNQLSQIVQNQNLAADDLLPTIRLLSKNLNEQEEIKELLFTLIQEVRAQNLDRPLSPESVDVLSTWFSYLQSAHAKLVPFFHDAGNDLLDTVYVELDLVRVFKEDGGCAEKDSREMGRLGKQVFPSLEDLMTTAATGSDKRWLIIGDPGSGKTTLARHLAWSLSNSAAGAEKAKYLPVYVSLSRWAETNRHPFDLAEEDLKSAYGERTGAGLADHLSAQSDKPGRVWLLLDGLDEVKSESIPAVLERLHVLSASLPNAVIAVLSRPTGCPKLGNEFRQARVHTLGTEAQKTLLIKWLGEAKGAEVFGHLATAQRWLQEEAGNPLMLTLIAILCKENGTLAPRRIDIYEQAISLLLKRGHHVQPKGVKDAASARRLVQTLSLRLQEGGQQVWSAAALDEELWAIRENNSRLSMQLEKTWETNENFLSDLGQNGGVLGPHDGAQAPWRYLHRSFKEYLSAVELVEKEKADGLLARVKGFKEEDAAQWSETLALAAGMFPAPMAFLEQLKNIDAKIAVRALLDVEGLSLKEALAFLWTIEYEGTNPPWNGDYLVRLIGRWRPPKQDVVQTLIGQVTKDRSVEELAFLHYAMESIGETPKREVFFKACGRWPKTGAPESEFQFVKIPGGEFLMGSPAGEEDAYEDERPQHEVVVSNFEMAQTPTTLAQYRKFDPKHKSKGEPNCPVTEVSWWMAYLYSKWIGARLPSEAEWEYACRAGTRTRYYNGDKESDLDRVGWYDKNSGRQLHPVGKKEPNQFGLCDMHGNVDEWCADWKGSYEEGRVVNPQGPAEGELRVLRGGSWLDYAGLCRSANRSAFHPGLRREYFGFRLFRGQESSRGAD